MISMMQKTMIELWNSLIKMEFTVKFRMSLNPANKKCRAAQLIKFKLRY